MSRYVSDYNKVVGLFESGTFATSTGSPFWIGDVQKHEIKDEEKLIETRFLGQLSRSFNTYLQGPRDVMGTITYLPTDMRLFGWTLGSVYSISGTTTSIATVTQINTNVQQNAFVSGTLNPPVSWTFEDSQISPTNGQNFIRTVNGIIPKMLKMKLKKGDRVEIDVDYQGQTLVYSSGASTTIGSLARRPYLWSDATLTLNGSSIQTANEIDFEINQNTEYPHYINGSRDISVAFRKNREYTLNVTMDWESSLAQMLYSNLYKGGSSFNSTLDLNASDTTGSQHFILTMSGCFITTMDDPSILEGVDVAKLTIKPKDVSATEYNTFIVSGIYNLN